MGMGFVPIVAMHAADSTTGRDKLGLSGCTLRTRTRRGRCRKCRYRVGRFGPRVVGIGLGGDARRRRASFFTRATRICSKYVVGLARRDFVTERPYLSG